eukprot:CAMPEP_0204207584 /NCGR_PEP_ID=MMETSP0361-20130328/71859_1 /ASSEMBLY_ACC=CAM_ASM_000343 /TAXON_ID=268821 /ORGANISM="Scrippsiella Hangoei, Strain SHTV-5" /LENGTH=62 /DNA_ID=CAMNT_0051171193 /DNA_START=43 /DNA_END=228 /DNA_ORIENTATION=+
MRPQWYIHASGDYAERQAEYCATPTERCYANQDEATMVSIRKLRLRPPASGDRATTLKAHSV